MPIKNTKGKLWIKLNDTNDKGKAKLKQKGTRLTKKIKVKYTEGIKCMKILDKEERDK